MSFILDIIRTVTIAKDRYHEIKTNFFLHILVDIGPKKTTLKGYFPKPFFARDMGCLKSIF